jgi:hypothetical protein
MGELDGGLWIVQILAKTIIYPLLMLLPIGFGGFWELNAFEFPWDL